MSEALVLPLTTIGIVIIIALFFSIFIRKLNQNEVIGFILAGFLLGPFWLNFLNPTDPLVVGFAELGLFILLFYLGVELSLKEFLGAGSTIFGLAIIDMGLTMGLGLLILLALGHNFLFGLIVGIMLFSTSTAIVAKFIIDNKLLDNAAAKISLSILILQDFLGILLLVFITTLSSSSTASPASLAIAAVVFAVSAFYAVYHLSKLVENWLSSNNFGHTEMTLYALGVGLIVATLATFIGLSSTIGAYFAGFALSETKAAGKIKKDVGFLRDFFLVFFFVGFGTTLFYDTSVHEIVLPTVGEFLFIFGLALVLSFGAILAHSLSSRIFGSIFGISSEDASLSAILLSPLGEFVIIIATVAISSSVLSPSEAKLISPLAFLLIIVTLILFQPMFRFRTIHQKLFSLIPRIPQSPKKSNVLPHTDYTLDQLKEIALSIFVILCFAIITIILYNDLPKFGVPILYSRQITSIILFLFFSSFPFYRASRAFWRIYKFIKVPKHKKLF
ncbi:MAG TPA: cation:proton antiporter [archaeon]|nr:cation:proton antiporter [archaeon]